MAQVIVISRLCQYTTYTDASATNPLNKLLSSDDSPLRAKFLKHGHNCAENEERMDIQCVHVNKLGRTKKQIVWDLC